MKKQVFNPFLPIGECIPDGEPHVFGDRVYLYGSHDKEGGETFCMLDYTVYSAPVDDLSDWRLEGVIYRAEQDPGYSERNFMYAPDVVRGNDGRYYLYYCMSGKDGVGGYFGPISVAVCDSPAGQYEYLGFVRNKDGSPMKKYVCFDPGVINDNGVVRVYYGTQYDFEEREDFPDEELIAAEMNMFGKSREEILKYSKSDSVMGAVTLTLEDDMLTGKDEPRHIIPYKVKGTDFEFHPFFEASSIRKVGEKYYFIYSSQKNHELCYAVSDLPDRNFRFGGTIVSNGDVGLNGRKDEDRLNMTGTT
ncbi:MAG: family 43 glycosylhydrolase, partial [Oscillospiraceae bacterium]|nr:family 43 glycosylhydrolase [Oscillospiraceae bacterium]